jgi:transposase
MRGFRKSEIHIILDNLSAHKTAKVTEFLARNPNVKLHFTPTYFSWLNQVEIWISRLEREVTARGIFTSVNDLARKINALHTRLLKNRSAFQVEIFRSPPENSPVLTNSLRRTTSL